MQAYFAQASLATNILHFFINLIVLLWHKVIEDFISLIALRSRMPVYMSNEFLYLRKVTNFRNMEKLTDINEC